MEAELNRLEAPPVVTRLLHKELCLPPAPAMLPDLPVLDHEQQTEASDFSREQTIRRASIEAITQATAVRTKTIV
eukprot:6683406-Pyramimonas_sp.AAC.1